MARKVLIVDDDRVGVTLISFTLRQHGYEIETAEDGLKALEAVQSFSPDIIVLDVQMPRMSGFEFMNELKAIPGRSSVPIIMMTANDNMQDIFFAEGVKGYFVKPVDPLKLEAKISQCLSAS